MASERIGTDEVCSLSRRWLLEPTLARMLIATDQTMAEVFSSEGIPWPGLFIISGFRSKAEQAEVNPSNPNSFHTCCPSLAADLRVGDLPASVTTPELWSQVGIVFKRKGGRWGGDFNPPDYNHFDIPSEVHCGRLF